MFKKLTSIFLICIIFLYSYTAMAFHKEETPLTYNKFWSFNAKNEPEENSTQRPHGKLENLDILKLDKSEKNWFFKPNNKGTPSEVPEDVKKLTDKYSAYFLGDTSKKIMYLTFDEGYENGYTSKILDTLKANKVTAAFFVTTPYIKGNPDLINRMVKEGHLVCNHSTKHPSMAETAKDPVKFENEFSVTEDAYREVTGKEMPRFFRPPMGKYSELSLFYTKKLGYKTIFWSFAYNDWNTKRQPSPVESQKMISRRAHNGAIVLLHAVSKTNSEILDSVIKDWKNQGYTLESLNKLP